MENQAQPTLPCHPLHCYRTRNRSFAHESATLCPRLLLGVGKKYKHSERSESIYLLLALSNERSETNLIGSFFTLPNDLGSLDDAILEAIRIDFGELIAIKFSPPWSYSLSAQNAGSGLASRLLRFDPCVLDHRTRPNPVALKEHREIRRRIDDRLQPAVDDMPLAE
jgi:hypothetical protein